MLKVTESWRNSAEVFH